MAKRNQPPQPKRHFPGGMAQIDWGNPQDESIDTGRPENVLMNHPEACGIYTQGYDDSSEYLDSTPQRRDFTYVSPERQRLRSKYGG